MNFGLFDTLILVAYMGLTILIGVYFKNRANSADEYIVADRSLGLSVFIATMVATSVGGGTLTGYVGKVYTDGIIILPTIIVFLIIQLCIAGFLAEKVRGFDGYTAPDILGKNYGRTSQLLGGIASMIYMLGTGPALQTIALGTVLNIVTGIPFQTGAIIAMAIIILYTVSSGMWGVAMTDYAQFIIMAIGIGIAGIIALNQADGWQNIVAQVPDTHLSLNTDVTKMIELAVVIAVPSLIDGNRYQRFYSAKDKSVAKKGYYLSVIPWALIFTSIILLGLSSNVLVPGVTGDKVFATLLNKTLPIGLKGIVFASLISAIMSTADSYMLVGATNFTKDIYVPFINPNADDKQILKVTRISVVGLGVLGLILALMVPNIMGVWSLASTAYVGGCFVPMMFALFTKKKRSSKAAVSSILLGGGTGIFLKITGKVIMGQSPIIIGVIISLMVFTLVTIGDKEKKIAA